MASAAAMEAEILSKLHSPTANLADIHHHFSTYLHPFTALKPTKKPSKATKPPDSAAVRALAKQFLPFLNQALSLLPKRLSQTSNPTKTPKQIVLNLFEVYRLCLDSLDLISSQLSCKPYSVHIQRARYIHCLEAREMLEEAESEGYAVLDSLRVLEGSGLTSRAVKGKPKYVPKANEKSVDQDLALLVVEIVVTLVKCASVNQSKCGDAYRKVLLLVDEAHIWFRVLEVDVAEKMQKLLATYLSRISIYLVTKSKCYDGELTLNFCSTTFREHCRSYLKVQMHKFARRICSYLFSQEDDQNSNIIDILKLVLDSVATECEVGVENEVVDFLELVSYCASKCCSRSNTVCNDVVELLRYLSSTFCEVKGEFAQVSSFTSSVVGIYAAGLSLATLCGSANSYPWEKSDGRSALSFFAEKEDVFLMLNDSLLGIKSYLNTTGGVNFSPSGNSILLPCLEALKFVCHPLAEFICSDKKGGLNEVHDSSVSPILYVIQEAFDQLSSIFLQYHSAAKNGNNVDKTTLRVAVAAVTLSCRTKREIKASSILVERIISASWTLAHGLKYIFVSLYNIAVTLVKAKRMLEASGVLEIACRASWKCVILICQILAEGESKCEELLSGDAATDLCNEACAKSAFLLDLLCQESHIEVERIVKESLESWSAAKTLLKELPSPLALVRQWVKIQCGYLNDETAYSARNLYSLLSSSMKTSERVLRFLMEQELVAYKEATGRNRKVCQKMRMKIMNILLDEFYDKDNPVEKSRILIERGSDIRANEEKDTEESVQCLSEAITTLSEITGDKFSCEANDLLAYAYCLRECWAQEVETKPKTKQPFEDLHTGVDLFFRPRCCHPAESGHRMCGDLLNMLYHMFDLLSIKGFTDLHIDIYKIMIRLFEWKKVPVGKLLAVLWKSRRLSHPLCPSPVTPKFVTEFCKNHGELDNLRYWTKYMEESQPLIVGFEQSFFSMLSPSSYHHDNAIHSDLTVENIKKAVSGLISSVPQSNECIFLVAYLYYDLCERLIQSGHMVEALFYAKEAHRLRSRLLQEKFIYSVDQQEEIYDETGELIQKCSYKVKNFCVRNPATTEAWFCGGMSCDIEGFVLTPWNILHCYLESTLQEGTIHEILGNGSEAETLLLWGKSISCLKSLPIFMVSFSTILGKLYRKQRLWNLADTELKGARGALTHISGGISCSWCKSVLEVTINQQLGDLHRNRCCNGAERPSFESLSNAMDIYRSILINLNEDQSKTTIHYPGPASTEIIKDNCDNLPSDQGQTASAVPPKGCRVKAEKVSRHLKKKDEKKNLQQAEVYNLRKTRSRHHNFQNNDGSLSSDMSIDLDTGSNSVDCRTCSHVQCRSDLEIKCSVADILLEVTSLCGKMKCLHCLLLDIHSSSSLSKLVCMRWELARRRLLLRSLISIAKCFRVCGNIHEAREVLLQSLLLLINRNTCLQYSSCPVTTLIDLIGEGFPRNILIIDGASLLYQICWMSLKRCHCNNTSQFCSELSSIGQSRVISWLRMVFILCHEIPIIFQKVSRLLAALYIIYNSVQTSELASKSLSISHWASFFHQAGIGTHINQELSSRIVLNGKCEGLKEIEKYNVCRSIASVLGKAKKSSLAPATEKEFNEVVLSFFRNLPSIRIMCVSCIGGADGDLLSELLHYPSSVQAWLLLSRLSADNHPISVLLPANSLVKEAAYDRNSSPFMLKSVVKRWRCPWVSSPVDDVASTFKLILEENYASSSVQLNGNTKRNKLAWWTKRKELDECLGDFLHNMEQSWLGPLKYLLSEEWPDFSDLESLQKKVLDELGYNDKGEYCQAISKNSPGNTNYHLDKDDSMLQIILNGGVYVHKPRNASTEVESMFSSFFKTLSDIDQLEEINHIRTKPVMLVLDYEVQMLPWESLPILKNQEVYRMPSLYSILITLDRCSEQRDRDVRAPAIFPWIDPLDSYYVLNPGGDLSDTQVEFENWFKDHHFEGIAGTAPTIEELIEALKSHDLFIYLGHGSGSQYFPGGQIKKLDKCSSTVLMGCSSGSLSLNGSYSPQGAPLHYLLAGSPVVIANLWEVTDKDIDRFAKAMLDAWLEERSSVSKDIDECDDITNELKSLSIRTRDRRKEISKKKVSQENGKKNVHTDLRIHRPMIGSFIGQARQACKLPFLIGASPVCYGVPTGITRKKKL